MAEERRSAMDVKLREIKLFLSGWGILLLLVGCGGDRAVLTQKVSGKNLAPLGYIVQVGAFTNLDNAVRFTKKLQDRGLNAYHFLDHSGLYKVRFGNYPSKDAALNRASEFKRMGIIADYYVIGPDRYAGIKDQLDDSVGIRNDIVNTAKRYIGVPYRWGGESPDTGFDCSGFAMVVYQLNGLDLPRSSREQWKAGRPINANQLSKGDLVFFATSGGQRVSHVGIYIGGNRFLHAPGRGRKIQTSLLSDSYFDLRFVGARTYL